MPEQHQLWLVDAKVEEWLQVVKGIRAARKSLGLEGGTQEAKGFLDQFTGGGPCLLAASDDASALMEAGRILEEASHGAARPALDPDPGDLETVRLAGVEEGLWPPREGEAGPQEARELEPDPTQVFERQLFDTAMILMTQTDGHPAQSFLLAKQLHEVTGCDILDLTADAIATTFGISFRNNDDDPVDDDDA